MWNDDVQITYLFTHKCASIRDPNTVQNKPCLSWCLNIWVLNFLKNLGRRAGLVVQQRTTMAKYRKNVQSTDECPLFPEPLIWHTLKALGNIRKYSRNSSFYTITQYNSFYLKRLIISSCPSSWISFLLHSTHRQCPL